MHSLVRVGAVGGHAHEQPEDRQGCREDGDCGTHAPSADGVSRGDGEDGGGEVGADVQRGIGLGSPMALDVMGDEPEATQLTVPLIAGLFLEIVP